VGKILETPEVFRVCPAIKEDRKGGKGIFGDARGFGETG